MESGNAQDQPIAIVTLDEFLKDKRSIKLNKTFLKIDVQGFEKNVLLGGKYSLLEIPVVLAECVLNSLYEESSDLITIIELMKEKGFMVAAIHSDYWFNGFSPDCDVIFTRV